MKKIFPVVLLFFCYTCIAQQEFHLLIGTYTNGKSKGIYIYKFNTKNADNSFVSSTASSNPSYLAVSPDQKFVYAVNEDAGSEKFPDGGAVTSFSFDAEQGSLKEINTQSSGGKHPCYVAIDSTGKWLFTGNYSSGTVGLFPLQKNGSIGTMQQLIQHNGSGPDTSRQRSAHVHSTVLSRNQQYLFVPDLGMDKVMAYQFNNQKGSLTTAPSPFAASVPGSGPRHFEFDQSNTYAYLMEEMSGTVVVYKFEKGILEKQQRISAMPKDFTGAIGSADIHLSPDGNFLYCSNRGGSNSISIFSISKQNGELMLIGHQSTFGKTPRNFNFDPSGNFLLVANQDSDEVVIFKINKQTGMLTDTHKRIPIPSPVCIKWIR